MRVRGREEIRKRILVHAAAFNLSLVIRGRFGFGTPRAPQGLTGGLRTPSSTGCQASATQRQARCFSVDCEGVKISRHPHSAHRDEAFP